MSMNGHIFQTVAETKDPARFTKTLEALEHHCTTQYESDFSSIFIDPPNNTLQVVPIPPKSYPPPKNYEFENIIYPHLLK